MESQPLLKIIYVLANFLILSDTLLFKYFSLYVFFGGNLDSADKFNNMYMSREFWTFYVFFGGNLDSADKFNNMYMSREFWTFYIFSSNAPF